jgi:valyl-tRNA synthetase
MPYICEVIYQDLYSDHKGMTKGGSIHLSHWPAPTTRLEDDFAELVGRELVFIATVIRRYKSEANLPLGSSLALVHLATEDEKLGSELRNAMADLMSITRAQRIEVGEVLPDDLLRLESIGTACVAIQP